VIEEAKMIESTVGPMNMARSATPLYTGKIIRASTGGITMLFPESNATGPIDVNRRFKGELCGAKWILSIRACSAPCTDIEHNPGNQRWTDDASFKMEAPKRSDAGQRCKLDLFESVVDHINMAFSARRFGIWESFHQTHRSDDAFCTMARARVPGHIGRIASDRR
jgi:hypothetical protein